LLVSRRRMNGPQPIETMRVFITGMGGFLGSHLAEFLLAERMAVYGTFHRATKNIEHLKSRLTILPCDILDKQRMKAIVAEVEPDVVVHLAAQSLPVLSWRDAETTFQVNVSGTLCLLDAIREAGGDPVVEVACSSAEYGFASEDEMPTKETGELRPTSPYGVSKVAVDLLSQLYWQTYGMKVVRVRPFFVIGPRKVGDVCSDSARGVVAIEKGRSDRLRVGNLDAVRDFVDVRDAVQAFWLLAEKGSPGEVYNVCSGVGHRVREVLELLITLSGNEIRYRVVPEKMRPYDVRICIGDNFKLKALGWKPQIPLERALAHILDYWRGIPE
jgi:GDP-4-dehydro-6-deoxy-D-mannose reductase